MRSLKALHPDLTVCVITDEPWPNEPKPDMVLQREAVLNVGAKPSYLGQSPFAETLFLDTDTIIVRPIIEVFDLLEYFDMGISFLSQFLRSDPYYLPWCNSGVILYRNNERMRQMCGLWLELYQQANDGQEEGHVLSDRFLPVALARSEVRVIPLGRSLNFYTGEPLTTSSPLRIIHSRDPVATRSAERINRGWDAAADWHGKIWIPQMKGYFPRGSLRPPGIWFEDPLIGLSMLLRRVKYNIARILEGRR